MKTLLLHSCYTDQMSYYDDWTDAFQDHKFFDTQCINVFKLNDNLHSIQKKIENFELVVLHHSMNADTVKYLEPLISALKHRTGKLVSFVGNEVNLPTVSMISKIEILQQIEPDIIATQLLQEAGAWLYNDCHKSKVISLPHALNQKAFFSSSNPGHRTIDIGTRSARYGPCVGDNDRNNIIEYFHKNSGQLGLSVDLGLDRQSQKRFDRQGWAKFLASCKATLSTEAGSFYLERDDQLSNLVQNFMENSSTKIVLPSDNWIRKIFHNAVPIIVRRTLMSCARRWVVEKVNLGDDFDFEQIYTQYFAAAQKCPVYSKAISSRHFDAIGTKTLQVMYPGRYNDILIPGEHYFELNKDHSNIDALKDCLNNADMLTQITDRVYEHVSANHRYEDRLNTLASYL